MLVSANNHRRALHQRLGFRRFSVVLIKEPSASPSGGVAVLREVRPPMLDIIETEVTGPVGPTGWMEAAKCTGKSDLFFAPFAERPEARVRREAKARAICEAARPSRCANLRTHQPELGFWGGESESERSDAGFPPTTPIIGRKRVAEERARSAMAQASYTSQDGRVSSPCCSPQREPRSPRRTVRPPRTVRSRPAPASDAVEIPAGSFRMGTDDDRFPADREGPVRSVDVPAFAIGRAPVTNAEFAAFVERTGLVTLAESDGWTFVFAGLLPDDFHRPVVLPEPSGGERSRVPTGAIRPVRTLISTASTTIPWCTSTGSRPRPMPSGSGVAFPPRPSGRRPHAEASTRPATPGATN